MIPDPATKGKRKDPIAVRTWGEAEELLAEVAGLEARLMAIELERAQAETRAEEQEAPLARRRTELCERLERFCREHADEFERRGAAGRRSRRLVFGRIGFRRSVGVQVNDERRAIGRLERARGGGRFLRRRTELDREAVRLYLLSRSASRSGGGTLDRALRHAGVRLDERDCWFFELQRRAAARWG